MRSAERMLPPKTQPFSGPGQSGVGVAVGELVVLVGSGSAMVDGSSVGSMVGSEVGLEVVVGSSDEVGSSVGSAVGSDDGSSVGISVGDGSMIKVMVERVVAVVVVPSRVNLAMSVQGLDPAEYANLQ